MSDHDPDATRVEPAVDRTSVFAAEGAGAPPTGVLPPVDRGPAVPPPPDRRLWIVAGLVALIALLLVVLLLTGDDDDGDEPAAPTTTTTLPVTTSTSAAPSTTATTAAPTTTEAAAVTVPLAECAELGEGEAQPGLAAGAVFDAWTRGDTACAAELMTAPALAELFSRDGEGAQDELQGCTEEEDPEPHVDCAFTYEGGSTHYLMTYGDDLGWRVYDVTQVAD